MMGQHGPDLQNLNMSDSSEAYRKLCSRYVVKDGRLLEVARVLSKTENCTNDLVDIFRDALDQFLALYYSAGEAKLALDLVHSRAPQVFSAVRRAMGQLVCFGRQISVDDSGATIAMPSWDNQMMDVPVSRILANRRVVLLWHLTGTAPEWHKPAPHWPGL